MSEATQLNDYTYHQAMLADPSARLPVQENSPQPGRYRLKRGNEWAPVAIWHDESGNLIVLSRDAVVAPDRQPSVWMSCARYPISEAEYERLLNGDIDDPVYAKLPTDSAGLKKRVAAISQLPTAIENSDDARLLADAAHVLKSIEKDCAERYKSAAEPLEGKIAALKADWKKPSEDAVTVRKPIMAALAEFLKKKNEPGGVRSQLGKAISLRTYKAIEVTDYPAAFGWFASKDPEAFRAIVEKLARAAIKAGEDVPGVIETEDRRAQ